MTPDEPTLEELAAEPAESVVRTYLASWNAHDVEGMMALLGDGIVIYYWEDGWRALRTILPVSNAWPMAAGLEIPGYELEVEDEQTVHVTLEQRTEVYDLLDYELPTQEITFTVTDGIIERIQYHDRREEEVQAEIEAYKEALAPVIAWAGEHRPWEAEALFARGEVIDPSGRTIRERRRKARQHVLLVEDYRNAIELEGLERDELHSVKWRRDSEGGGAAIVNANRRDRETGEVFPDNRRLGWRSLAELPEALAAILREDGAEKGVWRGTAPS